MLIVCLAGRMSTVYGKLQNAEIDGFEFTVTIAIPVSVLSIPPLCDAVLCFLDRDVHIEVQRDGLEGSLRAHSRRCVRCSTLSILRLCGVSRTLHIKVQRDRLVEGSMRVHSQHCVRLNIIHTSSVRRGFRG
jgi:hypothetical protein